MAYTPSTLTIASWTVPISISGADSIASLDETINAIIDTDTSSVKTHVNTELAKLPSYLGGEMTSIYNDLAGQVNVIAGLSSSADELNILDGATLTTTELNYVAGVTSQIQTQINAKVAKSGDTMTGNLEVPSLTIGGDYVSPFGFKNYIINGIPKIWQRGTSFVPAGANSYTADRWVVKGAAVNVSSGYIEKTRALLVSKDATNNTYSGIATRIEANELFFRGGETFTISFEIYLESALTSEASLGLGFRDNTDTVDGTQYTIPLSTCGINLSLVGTKQTGTHTFVMPNDQTAFYAFRIFIMFNTITGTTAYSVRLSKVQLEKGSVATPFEDRPIGLEGMLCKRYLPFIDNGGAANQMLGSGYANSTSNITVQIPIKQAMRIVPTAVSYSGNFEVVGSISTLAVSAMSININATKENLPLNCTVTGATVGESYILRPANDATAKIRIETEL